MKKANDEMKRKVITLLFIAVMSVGLCGCGSHSVSSGTYTTPESEPSLSISEEEPKKAESGEDDAAEEEVESPTAAAPTQEEKNSFSLKYDDAGAEISFDDCVCEYDKYNIRVYTYYVDDTNAENHGYAIYIQTPDDSMEIFPVKDYRVDKNSGTIYMLWGDETFERIQGVDFVHGLNGFKIESTYSMESLIGEVYDLKLLDNGDDFDNLQVEFTELYEEKGQTVLCGTASAVYNASGKTYDINWVIDTKDYSISADADATAYLSDLDIHPLYAGFLRDEISVANPYVAEGAANTELSFFDDREYESVIAPYPGKPIEWLDCKVFADIPY